MKEFIGLCRKGETLRWELEPNIKPGTFYLTSKPYPNPIAKDDGSSLILESEHCSQIGFINYAEGSFVVEIHKDIVLRAEYEVQRSRKEKR